MAAVGDRFDRINDQVGKKLPKFTGEAQDLATFVEFPGSLDLLGVEFDRVQLKDLFKRGRTAHEAGGGNLTHKAESLLGDVGNPLNFTFRHFEMLVSPEGIAAGEVN